MFSFEPKNERKISALKIYFHGFEPHSRNYVFFDADHHFETHKIGFKDFDQQWHVPKRGLEPVKIFTKSSAKV